MIKADKPLVQWEKDRSVVIETKESYNKVHFYNKNSTEAPVVLPRKDNTAPIPNILLQEDLPIIVRLVYATGNEERYIEFAVLNVEKNTKPADYVYTETEVITFKKLVRDVEEAVSNANAVAEDLEKKRDSGFFNGQDGKDGKDGYTPKKGVDYLTEADIALAKLMAKDVVKDYIADELKGPQSEIEEIRSEIVEIRDAVASLENMIAPCNPFDVSFETVPKDSLIYGGSGRYSMSANTSGDNWRVSDECDSSVLATEEGTASSARVHFDEYTYFKAYSKNRNYVFDFTAPASRYYNIAVNVVLANSGGYADIFVNNVKVGTIDTYYAEQKLETFSLGTVRLKAGKFANKIKIVPTGASGGSKYYPSIAGFSFTAPNE